MPDESCRKCGGMLINSIKCVQCKGVVGMICVICGTSPQEKFHYTCQTLVDKIQTGNVIYQEGYPLQKIILLT